MMLLYVVSESDSDAHFYAECVRKLTGIELEFWPLKNRKGDGVVAVTKQFRNALLMATAAAGSSQPVGFLAAMDNDRAPHPENVSLDRTRLFAEERDSENRPEWMEATVENVLGQNRYAWPLPVALAAPVEMVEAWIVRARRETPPQPMAHFSWSDSASARHYYPRSTPPPQWKDLAAAVQSGTGLRDKIAFYTKVVAELDADALAARSLSFQMFKRWLDAWPRAATLS